MTVSPTWLAVMRAVSEATTVAMVDEALPVTVVDALLRPLSIRSFIQVGDGLRAPIVAATRTLGGDAVGWFGRRAVEPAGGLPCMIAINGPSEIEPPTASGLLLVTGDHRVPSWAGREDVIVAHWEPHGDGTGRSAVDLPELFHVTDDHGSIAVHTNCRPGGAGPISALVTDLGTSAVRHTLEVHLASAARSQADRAIVERSMRSVRGDFRAMVTEAHRAEEQRMLQALAGRTDRSAVVPAESPADPLLRWLLRLKYRVGRSRVGGRLRPWYERILDR